MFFKLPFKLLSGLSFGFSFRLFRLLFRLSRALSGCCPVNRFDTHFILKFEDFIFHKSSELSIEFSFEQLKYYLKITVTQIFGAVLLTFARVEPWSSFSLLKQEDFSTVSIMTCPCGL